MCSAYNPSLGCTPVSKPALSFLDEQAAQAQWLKTEMCMFAVLPCSCLFVVPKVMTPVCAWQWLSCWDASQHQGIQPQQQRPAQQHLLLPSGLRVLGVLMSMLEHDVNHSPTPRHSLSQSTLCASSWHMSVLHTQMHAQPEVCSSRCSTSLRIGVGKLRGNLWVDGATCRAWYIVRKAVHCSVQATCCNSSSGAYLVPWQFDSNKSSAGNMSPALHRWVHGLLLVVVTLSLLSGPNIRSPGSGDLLFAIGQQWAAVQTVVVCMPSACIICVP